MSSIAIYTDARTPTVQAQGGTLPPAHARLFEYAAETLLQRHTATQLQLHCSRYQTQAEAVRALGLASCYNASFSRILNGGRVSRERENEIRVALNLPEMDRYGKYKKWDEMETEALARLLGER